MASVSSLLIGVPPPRASGAAPSRRRGRWLLLSHHEKRAPLLISRRNLSSRTASERARRIPCRDRIVQDPRHGSSRRRWSQPPLANDFPPELRRPQPRRQHVL